MKRAYETVVVFDGTLPEDAIAKEVEKIEQVISAQGELEKTVPWGKRSLAYEINRKRSGYYFLILYKSEAPLINELDRRFKLNEMVLRHQTVRQTGENTANIGPDSPSIPPNKVIEPIRQDNDEE